ncbi:hypothetical protein OS493_009129 [Desmophyllum pertusum]|uniref:Uncharacterized protein n=1 Tax=Desmophyllum pertusum TaxID=174260 RepID=A0A9W9Z2C8_9CNID|nr:hypothetical protein OS493_009129 [Desmophyllum pertusum]
MEETKEVTTSLKSRRLKRKSEEGSIIIIDSSRGVNSPQDRSSPKLRKYSRRLPPTDNEHCTVDNNTNQIDMKENALLSSCQTPEYALKASKGKQPETAAEARTERSHLFLV